MDLSPDSKLTRRQAAQALTDEGYPTADGDPCDEGDARRRAALPTLRQSSDLHLGTDPRMGREPALGSRRI